MLRALTITILCISCPVWAVPTTADKSAKPDIKKDVEKLQAQVDKIKFFSAEFKQTFRHKILKKDDTSEGTVKFKAPGFMRWDYTKPSAKSFIVDGKKLWIHQPKDKLAMVDHCFKQDSLTASLSFLWGGGNIAKQFKAEYFDGQLGETGDLNIQLTPKEKSKFYKRIILVLDSAYQVKQSVVVDLEGNTNRFKFTDVQFKEIDASAFVFKLPENTHLSKIPGSVENCK